MRKEELRGSCESLGIDLARCVALDHAELQDNPMVWWNTDLIQSIVAEYVQKWDIDAVSSLFPTSIIYRTVPYCTVPYWICFGKCY
jgi:hypothetical protein